MPDINSSASLPDTSFSYIKRLERKNRSLAKEVVRLRQEKATLNKLIEDHNQNCELACNKMTPCKAFADRGILGPRCSECPRHWLIEL